jgi:hypothetical protein
MFFFCFIFFLFYQWWKVKGGKFSVKVLISLRCSCFPPLERSGKLIVEFNPLDDLVSVAVFIKNH